MSFLSKLFRGRRYDDLSVSIQEHIDERADELVAEGKPRPEAQQMARREFGNVGLIEERSREAWQWPSAESILADVRFGLRQLARTPGFTATAVITLALGIAVNATMFSMVSGFLMPKLPGPDPQHIVVPSSINPDAQFLPDVSPVSVPNYVAWRNDKRVFAEMAAADAKRWVTLDGGQDQEVLAAAMLERTLAAIASVDGAAVGT